MRGGRRAVTSWHSSTDGSSSSNEFGVRGLGVVKAIVFGIIPQLMSGSLITMCGLF